MIFLIAASVLLYILFYTTISNGIVLSPEFGTFYMLMSAPQTYFALILFTFMFVLVDTGTQYLNIYINKWYLTHKEKHIKVQAKKNKASKSTIKRKVARAPNRGFAFSQEAGNDRLVTDSLTDRLLKGVMNAIETQTMIDLNTVTNDM